MIYMWLWLIIGIWLGGVLIGVGVHYALIQSKSSSYARLKREIESKLDTVDQEIEKRKSQAEDIIQRAQREASEIAKSAESQASKIKDFAQAESAKIMSKVDQLQSKLEDKERKIDEKYEQLDTQKQRLAQKEDEVSRALEQQQHKLESIAQLTAAQAREEIVAIAERQWANDVLQITDKYRQLIQQETEQEAINLISKVIPRIATNAVAEFTVTNVDLPTEETKGRLIGREGRNVSYFEKCTGVELIIDDTPLQVKLSCYDHEKRRVAKEVLKTLIKDGRINPVYIQKVYDEVVSDMDNLLLTKGKEALAELNMPPQHPDITRMIGQFYLRYSYGQNLWIHSVEVAKMAEILANEMWLDGHLAKKAWLLHDIGKVVANQGESHTAIGADVLRKYGYDEITINTAEWHHHDVPMISPIWWVVAACDAISASRPGARFNSKQFFIDKMWELEKLISSVSGVDKVHIMQAGREIMIFVNPQTVDDLGVHKLVKEVATKVESQLDYPGMIRVVAMRETKVIDYLR